MIELFGITLSSQMLFFIFVVTIGILMLVLFRNRKYNLFTIQAIGKELESALQPVDQTYTWLGGSVGFNAEYSTEKPLRKVDATVTMLARQSMLFYPISKLLFGNDRLFVVLYPSHKTIKREAHILDHWYYKLRLRTFDNESALKHSSIQLNGKTFDIFSSDQAGITMLTAWIQALPCSERVKHVALTPDSGTVYLYMDPKVETVAPVVRALKKFVE
ncbi:hypothetical protein CSA56_13755 [candidate division KSB3 bacterium]|uniref:Uncharacterized protein n=1 Tax=candidate division KSB3 bacterium TaxID=2044937 RepID=A0A2G6KAY8_9BACT|nr:MAG: hypothetical protein CSA56_13755 [candidate division KSB3 bacterium]